jgi:cobalt-zinc-cadmium efflux system outer membrane protein
VRALERAALATSLVALAACATAPADRGFGDVQRTAATRGVALPDTTESDRATVVADALSRPLTVDDAVRVAFVASPAVQREYAALGLSAADVVRAGRLGNPTLAASWQSSSRSSDASRYDLGLTQNFAELLLLSARSRFARGEFERTKLAATQRLLDVASGVAHAYYEALGAEQIAQMRRTIANAASASAMLAQRFKDAGNVDALELAVNEAQASQAALDEEAARADATRLRSALNERMGLAAGATWQLAALREPVPQEDALDALQQRAADHRADLESDRRVVVLLEDALGVARSYRFVGDVDVGVQYERDTDRSKLLGPSLALRLPLFQQGQASVLHAEALLDQARAQLRVTEIAVSNAVFIANDGVMATRRRIERLRSETIPLREQIVARTQERQNYMLVGVFELLRAKQDEYAAYQQYLEAVRDYWLARVELAHAVGARLPSDAYISASPVVAPSLDSTSKTDQSSAPPAGAAGASMMPDHHTHGDSP